MSKQNGSKICVAVMLLCVLLHINVANATTFMVGDAGGWGFSVGSWAAGKTFKAGDILVFKYLAGVHSVVVVDKNGYDSCNPDGGKEFSSGNDKITLAPGTTYFICGVGGHCAAGMKIAITTT